MCDEVKEGHGGWGRTGSAVSDLYIKVVFEETVWPQLGPTYEVVSIFVRSSDDLLKLSGATIAPLLKGRHKVGMYFLWPVVFHDSSTSPGYVNSWNLLQMMASFEGAGITTRFPHHSHLYKLLLSKDWCCYLGWDKNMGTPPTTKVPRSLIANNPNHAANQAIAAIQRISLFRNGVAPNLDVPQKGIAKLGYSWEATDVRCFEGPGQLALALKDLAEQPASFVEGVLVQEWVNFDIEIRLFWVDADIGIDPKTKTLRKPNPSKILYTAFNTIDHEQRMRDFERFSRVDAVARCFSGDEAAMTDAETQAVELGRNLLMFINAECCEPPPVLRMDFMIKRTGPGQAVVHTGELTELGGCFLGWPEGPEVIWGAVLRSCFREQCYGIGAEQCRCRVPKGPFLKPVPRPRWEGKGKGKGKGKSKGDPSANAEAPAKPQPKPAWQKPPPQ